MKSPVFRERKWGSPLIHKKAGTPAASWVASKVLLYLAASTHGLEGRGRAPKSEESEELSDDEEDILEEEYDLQRPLESFPFFFFLLAFRACRFFFSMARRCLSLRMARAPSSLEDDVPYALGSVEEPHRRPVQGVLRVQVHGVVRPVVKVSLKVSQADFGERLRGFLVSDTYVARAREITSYCCGACRGDAVPTPGAWFPWCVRGGGGGGSAQG